jgi:hypothetical protein
MQSQIPVMTPRPSQSTLPSSLCTPNLGLVAPTRHLAVSGSPTHPPVNSGSSNSPGGLAPFRSFRNFLSFGPGKGSPSNSNTASPSSSSSTPRASLGGIRRSTNGERSSSHIPIPRSKEAQPPLAIELSHQVDEPLIDNEELQRRLCISSHTLESTSSLSPVSTLSSRAAVVPVECSGTSE